MKIPVSFIIATIVTIIGFFVGFHFLEIEINAILALIIIVFSLGIGGLVKIGGQYSIIIPTIATLITFFVGFHFLEIEINTNLAFTIIVFSLGIGGLWKIRKRFHGGQLPIILGLVFIGYGGFLFYGSLEYNYEDSETGEVKLKEKLWDFSSRNAGVFILVVVAGIISFVTGGKQAWQAMYFWGSVKSR